ncbi:MAG TPA: hypothetical protein VGB94_01790 [Acidobacteriaceae bacterium]
MPAEDPDNQTQQPNSAPIPPRLHWGWVLGLAIVTGGLFSFFWLLMQADWAKKFKESKALPLSIGLLIAWITALIAYFGMLLFRGSALATATAFVYILVALAQFILYLATIYTLRSTLQHPAIGIRLGPVMTFFFSSIYFQYHLMKYGLEPEAESGPISIAPPVRIFENLSAQRTVQPPPSETASLSTFASAAPKFVAAGSRYSDLEQHELWQLLDDMDDERARARRREAFYLSTIVYLLLAWFIFYGPSVLWHQPHMVNPADILKQKNLTYLDLPPDALKQLKPKTPPKTLSDKDRTEQTVKPTLDKKTLKHLQEQEPPAPAPQPTQQAQLPPSPQPQPPPMHPQPNQQSMLDAPKPQPSKPSFNQPRSAGDNLRNLANNAIPTRPGFGGRFGDAGVPHHSGLQAPVEVLSDTTGVDENQLNAYLKRLLHDVKQTWLPLLPEETYPPLTKQGETLIRFTIAPDGKVLGMQLVDSTHDNAINRAAWGSITGTSFGVLPKGMKDPNLTLLIRYMVNERDE